MTTLEKWKNDFKEFISELSIPRDDYKGIMEYINEVPNGALEQEPCDMKQRVEKEYLYESLCEDLKKANAEIKRLSEPFEDAISRQAVDELSKELVHTTRDKADFLCNFWEGLQKLPSVTPKEKTGHWIKYSIPRCGEQHYQCTSCGYYINFGQWGEVYTKQFKYCPNCGAKMQEVEE